MSGERRGWARTLAAAVLLLAIGAAPAAAGPLASDLWTTFQVTLDLILADTDDLDIDVDTADGLITLYGYAASDTEKAKAESIARGVGGTRTVRNLIQVVPPAEDAAARSDDEIRLELGRLLRADPELGDVRVASVERGVVVLDGRVDTPAGHLRAIAMAEGVGGVSHVASELRSSDRIADAEIWRDSRVRGEPPAEPLRDAWITAATKLRLLASEAADRDIAVRARAGVVTLLGRVGSEEERSRAAQMAERVALVRGVENELEVVAPRQRAALGRPFDVDVSAAPE
jgi:osmotically-inducible protein OsmY